VIRFDFQIASWLLKRYDSIPILFSSFQIIIEHGN
jgi:hypothetical protein